MMFPATQGLLAGLEKKLQPDELALLSDAFQSLRITEAGHHVLAPGNRILVSYERESLVPSKLRDAFQDRLVALLREARAGVSSSAMCCGYHPQKLSSIQSAIAARDSQWILTLLEVLTSTTQNLHAQVRSTIGTESDPHAFLSRFMPLKAFFKAHVKSKYTDFMRKKFVKRLSPHSTRALRAAARDGALGTWFGRVGTYPSVFHKVARSHRTNLVFCDGVKPFATLTSEIDPADRHGPPDAVLKTLGVPFGRGEDWIELVYNSADVSFVDSRTRVLGLAVPTCIERANKWAFRPDRDAPVRTNFAVDLSTDLRGRPEVLHEKLGIKALYDAIVWGAPTERTWAEPTSPLAV